MSNSKTGINENKNIESDIIITWTEIGTIDINKYLKKCVGIFKEILENDKICKELTKYINVN